MSWPLFLFRVASGGEKLFLPPLSLSLTIRECMINDYGEYYFRFDCCALFGYCKFGRERDDKFFFLLVSIWTLRGGRLMVLCLL